MALQVKKKTTSTILWLVSWSLIMIYHVSLAERILEDKESENLVIMKERQGGVIINRVIDFFSYSGKSSYDRVWPVSLLSKQHFDTFVMFLAV